MARLRSRVRGWRPSGEVALVATALVVGLGAGLGAVAFRYLIRLIGWLGYEVIPAATRTWGTTYVVIVPAVGGLIVGLLIYFFAPEARGHGVPEVMEAVALRDGRIRPIVALIKALASSVCIGSGGSVGREGPIVQIGAGLGSTMAQALKLSSERTTNLVACGAAAGIAATFNAPIAGSIFALELILGGRFQVRHFSSVVVSAVAASVVGRVAFGDVPAFVLPVQYGVRTLWEFLLYPLLGVLAALAGVAFVRLLYGTEDLFDRWTAAPVWLRPAAGGVLLGVVALLYPRVTGVTWTGTPQIFNVGYEVIGQALSNRLALGALVALFVLKLLATSLTLGSGGSGGVFAPSLFLGATLGGAFEAVARGFLPEVMAPSGAYALVGMAAVFAAAAHAPITAVLILFELTGDYRIILPLMLTVAVSTLLAQRLLGGESIYTLKLTRRGIRLEQGRVTDLLEAVKVRDVMTPPQTVSADAPLADLATAFESTQRRNLLVLDTAGRLWGLATVTDLDRALEEGRSRDTPIREIATERARLEVTHPDETIGGALRRMARRGYESLPVVSPTDGNEPRGLIRRRDLIRAYDLALSRTTEIRQAVERGRQQSGPGGTPGFVEVQLEPGDPVTGMAVRDVAPALPADCVLVSIRRGGSVVIPHGDTVLEPGDRLVAFAHPDEAVKLRRWLKGDAKEATAS